MTREPIGVAVVDDHPAVLAGLEQLVRRAEDLRPVAFVERPAELRARLERDRADVVVIDVDLGRGDGLAVCQWLKERPRPPAAVLYSAYAGPALAIGARVAGADGVASKADPVEALFALIRHVAGGGRRLPDVSLELRRAAIGRLDDEDVPVASMLLAGTAPRDIAHALALERREVASRTRRIVARVRPGAREWPSAPEPGRPLSE